MEALKTVELKLIGAFLLVTGVYGLFMFLRIVFPIDSIIDLLNLIPTIFFGLSVYSGYLIIIKEDIKGLEISQAIFALQIFNFHVAGVGYLYVTGIYLLIGFVNFDFRMNLGIDNTFIINLSEDSNSVIFNINVVSLLIFYYINKKLKVVSND